MEVGTGELLLSGCAGGGRCRFTRLFFSKRGTDRAGSSVLGRCSVEAAAVWGGAVEDTCGTNSTFFRFSEGADVAGSSAPDVSSDVGGRLSSDTAGEISRFDFAFFFFRLGAATASPESKCSGRFVEVAS